MIVSHHGNAARYSDRSQVLCPGWLSGHVVDHFEVWEEKEGGTWDRRGRAAG